LATFQKNSSLAWLFDSCQEGAKVFHQTQDLLQSQKKLNKLTPMTYLQLLGKVS
jgi:hypothetical protein